MEVTRDALLLDGWVTVGIKQVGRDREITARYVPEPKACTKCGVIGKFHGHGPVTSSYADTPGWGGSVRIIADLKRYLCLECKSTFIQPITGMDAGRRMTQRGIEYVQRRCFTATFTHIANEMGIDDTTIRNIASDYLAVLESQFKPEIPAWIGLDETTLDGKLRCVITDVVNKKPIDLLIDREKPTVAGWLWRFRDRAHVKGLSIDMWRPYKDAAQAVFPGLPVVVDKFHVVRMANTGMTDIRTKLSKEVDKPRGSYWKRRKILLDMRHKNLDDDGREELKQWIDNEPQFGEAYWLKERFYDIYDAPTKEEAGRLLDAWRADVPKWMCWEQKKGYAPLMSCTKNWRDEILEFFTHPVTNAYTEALNGVTKVANRMGRGYSYEIIRARLLFRNLPDEIDMTPRHYNLEPGARAPSRTTYDWPQCMNCLAEYPPSQMTVDSLPFPEGHVLNMALLCPECEDRFHG